MTILKASLVILRRNDPVRQPTKIPFDSSCMHQLLSLVHGEEVLQLNGYKINAFSPEELQSLRRCQNCHGMYVLPQNILA